MHLIFVLQENVATVDLLISLAITAASDIILLLQHHGDQAYHWWGLNKSKPDKFGSNMLYNHNKP